jgi:hypothetical protein
MKVLMQAPIEREWGSETFRIIRHREVYRQTDLDTIDLGQPLCNQEISLSSSRNSRHDTRRRLHRRNPCRAAGRGSAAPVR